MTHFFDTMRRRVDMSASRWTPLLAVLAACGSPVGLDVDMDTFDAIPAIESLAVSHLQPASNWDYWEVRRVISGAQVPVRIIGNGGPMSRAELSPSVTAELDALAPQVGFAIGCLPGFCFTYLAAVRNEEVTTFLHLDELRLFMGAVDTMEEAVLIVHAHGYDWEHTGKTGVRALPNGDWEFVVVQLVRDCMPVQYDRVLLRVDRSGHVSTRGREVWEKLEGACV